MHTQKSFGRRRLRKLPAVALTAAALAVLPAVPASADTPAVAPAVTGADFYTPPDRVGDYANGAIIKYEDSAVAYLGVPAKRIMYRSNDVNNQPVAVTGTLLQATAPWRGPGARPLVSYAVGTIGQGDQCAPSKLFNQGLEYEAAPLFPMLAAGVDVVVTDYEGLGDPTRVHTYVNRVDEANAVLDAAIAAKNLGAMGVPGVDVPAAGKVGIYGYSQGGGAAAAAAELQHAYAPSLDSLLVGTAAGAPPADLAKVAENIDGGSLAGAFGYTINGLIQDYPEIADPSTPGNIYSLLNDQGKNVLAATAGECVAETALRFAFQHTSSYTVSGQPATSFLADPKLPYQRIVDAQKIGTLSPTAPVYIWQGRNDDVVPFGQSLQLAKDWCGKTGHAPVQFKEYNFPAVFPGVGIGHVLPAVLGLPEAQGWLYQRLIGVPATDGCGALPAA